jgi:hypothetical protein
VRIVGLGIMSFGFETGFDLNSAFVHLYFETFNFYVSVGAYSDDKMLFADEKVVVEVGGYSENSLDNDAKRIKRQFHGSLHGLVFNSIR